MIWRILGVWCGLTVLFAAGWSRFFGRIPADPITIVDLRASTAAVDEAERIVRDAYTTDRSTWP